MTWVLRLTYRIWSGRRADFCLHFLQGFPNPGTKAMWPPYLFWIKINHSRYEESYEEFPSWSTTGTYAIFYLWLLIVCSHFIHSRKEKTLLGWSVLQCMEAVSNHVQICDTPSNSWSVMCYILPSMMTLHQCFGKEEKVYKGSVWFWSIAKAGISQKCFTAKSAMLMYSMEMQPI